MIHTLFLCVIVLLATPSITCSTQELFTKAQKHREIEQFDAAILLYQQILTCDSTNLTAMFYLGTCYLNIGILDKAIEIFDTIIQKSPSSIAAWYNKGYTLKTAGKLSEAIAIYEQIIRNNPDYEPAHLSLGFAYLANGDFERGWKQHERYLQKSGKNAPQLRQLLRTNDLNKKTILLTYEGGLGDTIQYIRYAQRLKEMGAHITAMVQKPLIPLLSLCPYIDQLLSEQTEKSHYDAHATLMSLPALFNDNETTFPHTIPYIFPDPTLVEKWKNFCAQDTNFKIGICWEADVHNDKSRLPIARRGIPLHYFTQLASIENSSWYSLQKCDGLDQLTILDKAFTLTLFPQLDEQSGPFMDTAAIMESMDLIITVDTAIAHLAGALGKPTLLLHPYVTDWRWLNNRTDSPWYPTMTIFKQDTPFDWQPVINKVKEHLLTRKKS